MISRIISKKAFFLFLLIGGYQSATLCVSTLEWLLGAAASASGIGLVYFAKKYRSHKARFEDQEIISDAYDMVQEIYSSYPDLIRAYNSARDGRQRSNAIGAVLSNQISGSLRGGHWLYKAYQRFVYVSDSLERDILALREHRKNLAEKKAQWSGERAKEFLSGQLDSVIAEIDGLSAALTFSKQELPYVCCCDYQKSGLSEALSSESALGDIVHNEREIKYQLEKIVTAQARGNRFPYSQYYENCVTVLRAVKSTLTFCKTLNIQPHHDHHVVKEVTDQLESYTAKLKRLSDYVFKSREFKQEEAIKEAERREREARLEAQRRALEAQLLQQRLEREAKERVRESERRAREAENTADESQRRERLAQEAHERSRESERRASASERRAHEAEQRAHDAQRREREAQLYHAAQQPPTTPNRYESQPSAPSYAEIKGYDQPVTYEDSTGHPEPSAPPAEPVPSAPPLDDEDQ